MSAKEQKDRWSFELKGTQRINWLLNCGLKERHDDIPNEIDQVEQSQRQPDDSVDGPAGQQEGDGESQNDQVGCDEAAEKRKSDHCVVEFEVKVEFQVFREEIGHDEAKEASQKGISGQGRHNGFEDCPRRQCTDKQRKNLHVFDVDPDPKYHHERSGKWNSEKLGHDVKRNHE